jgi:MSHA biogenesis protein MshN
MDVFTMSLINKVLINIDKHQEAAEQIKPQASYDGLSPVARSDYNQMTPWALGIVVAGVAAGAFLWSQYHKPSAKLPQPIAQAVLPLETKTTNASAAKLTAPVDSEKVSAAPVVAKPVTTAPATEIASSDVVKPLKQDKLEKLPAGKEAIEVASNDVVKAPKQDRQQKLSASNEVSIKVWSPEQRSDNFYRLGQLFVQQSKVTEAQQALKQAIDVNVANHSARRLLAELMIDAGHNAEAKVLLQDGLTLSHGRSDFTMPLARLQVADGNKDQALSTLDQGLASAGDNPEYHAFLAALLQEQGHHEEAIKHYITALRSNPSMPSALIGVGVSLRAQNKMNDAAEAFQRAIDTGELAPEVAQFAVQQLKQIRQ